MGKTMIVVAAAVLAVGSTSLSTSASAFGLIPLGGFGLVHPGFALGHLDGSISGRRFGGGPSYGGYDHGGESFHRGYTYPATPLYGGYDYGGQSYYGGQAYYGDNTDDSGPYDGDSAYAREPYDGSNYTDTSARGRRSRRAAAHR